MKNLYICICLFFCGTLFAISTKENEMILQTRELKQQWENASTGIVGDNRKIDLEKIGQLQKEYAISLVALITYAIKEDNFEQDNSLWSLLLNDPDFHVDVISLTLNTNNLSVTKRKNVLEKIIRSMEHNELQKYNIITLNRFLLSGVNVFLTPEQEYRIVTLILNCPKLSLLFCGAFPNEQRIDSYLWAQASELDNQLAEGKFVPKAWLALCMLASRKDVKALEKVLAIADKIPVVDVFSLNMIPLGLAMIGSQETVERLAEMQKSNLKTMIDDDAVPSQTQLCHTAASSLGLIFDGFPQYSFYSDFSTADNQKCITWMKQNGNKIVINNKDWRFFYTNTLLGNIE